MAFEDGSRINIEAFQLVSGGNTLDVMAGIAVRYGRGGDYFVNPGNTGGYTDDTPKPEDLVLGIDEELEAHISSTGRVHQGSLYVEDSRDLSLPLREPFGVDRLGLPAEISMGRYALVGVAENKNFSVTEIVPGWFNQTRLLDRSPRYFMNRHVGDNLLILLSHGGLIKVACGQGYDMNVYTLQHDRPNQRLEIARLTDYKQSGPADEPGDAGGGPDSKDPEPSMPHSPVGSAGAAAIPPRAGETSLDLRARKAS